MKNLLLIGGTMGVGKTTVCQILKNRLDKCVFLDGDWCWDMHPFVVNDETKEMVMGNICYLINSFLRCTQLETVVLGWVMHDQSIIDDILSRIDRSLCDVEVISLVCDGASLKERLLRDVERGVRTADVVERSVARIPLYERLHTKKLDVSRITAQQAAESLAAHVLAKKDGRFPERIG
jgi:broad-specificity NMP kinase